ncbi:hypothetical protein FBU30_010976 [Linnemannia zychae]|nr:hypothetical protein FBU30_010976 [Linnemannia zychae]
MATTHSQKTLAVVPSSSHKRRHATDTTRKPRVVFPTLLQPDPEDSVPTMSIADSALLRATLVHSRHSWTHTAFTRFVPEPPIRGTGGKKYASETTLAGLCTVCIGPHMFLETKFFNIYNPPPPPVAPISTPSTASNTGTNTPTSEYIAMSPPASPPVILGGSPAPERVIELIMARTANMAAEAAAAGAIPESLGPTPMDIETVVGSSSNTKPFELMHSESIHQSTSATTETLAAKDEDPTILAQIKSESQENAVTIPHASSPAPIISSIKGKIPAARSQRPRHQVAFEFKENPGVRWLFPHETSLERIPPDGDAPGKISASFFLPTMEESRIGIAPGAVAPLVPGPGQATTMVILQATPELWTGLSQAINDPAATYRFMMEKLKHIPPRQYVQYKLPVDFPDEQLHPMGLKKLPDNRVVPLTSLQPSKRKSELTTEHHTPAAKAKKPKPGQDEPTVSKPPMLTKKPPPPVPTPAPTSSASSPTQKKCSYCDSTSTPMWRRGPNGPGTLCNACGVKWKHGKILEDASEKAKPATTATTTAATSVVTAATVTTAATTATTKPAAATPTVATPPSIVTPAPTQAFAAAGPVSLTTTAEAAARMHHGLSNSGSNEATDEGDSWSKTNTDSEAKPGSKKPHAGLKKKYSCASEDSSASDAVQSTEGEKGETKAGRKRKAGLPGSSGPKLVPIGQLGEKQSKSTGKKDKEKAKPKVKEKTKDKTKEKDKDKGKETAKEKEKIDSHSQGHESQLENYQRNINTHEKEEIKDGQTTMRTETEKSKDSDISIPSTGQQTSMEAEESSQSSLGSPSSQETSSIGSSTASSPIVVAPTLGSTSSVAKPVTAVSAKTTTAKTTGAKAPSAKSATTPKASKPKTTTVSTTTASSTAPMSKTTTMAATSASAKLELLRTYAGAIPKYQVTHTAGGTAHLADDGLSLYATKNLYTNNTATFPLHFPTISIAFGPNNAYYTYPNCAVVLFENHFQIKLIQSGERAEIDVYKEAIEGTEFQVIDVGDGESMIVMKSIFRKHLIRFDKELLNPDKNECTMVFRFRERLDGGGPPVKPLLEQWLTTEIPVVGASLKKS